MKITSFNPQILTKDMESLAKLFEELGFEKKHNPTGIGEYDVSAIRMADASGFHVDLSEGKDTPIPHDMIVIRMNETALTKHMSCSAPTVSKTFMEIRSWRQDPLSLRS